MVAASATTVVVSLPVFLIGALSVELGRDLAFGVARLGVAIAIYRASGAMWAVVLAPLVDRFGAVASLRMAALIAAGACLGVAAFATNWVTLIGWLFFGSSAVPLADAAANRLLLNRVMPRRQGLAFGIKQSALPVSGLLAGLSLPVVGLTLGWRYAFVLNAILAGAVLLGLRVSGVGAKSHSSSGPRATSPRLHDRRTVILLAVSFGFTIGASQTVPVFYVDASVTSGTSPQFAGTLLAIASAATVANRLVWGGLADRMAKGHLRVCSGGMALGAVGFVLLALGSPWTMPVGALVALVGTWGFSGVFWFAIMQAYPESPGRLTGAVLPAGLMGGTLVPIAFGFIVESLGYRPAWVFAVGLATGGAVVMFLSARRLLTFSPRGQMLGE